MWRHFTLTTKPPAYITFDGMNRGKNKYLRNVHFISGEIFDVRSIFPTLFGSGVAKNFRQGVRQSVAFLSVHSRSAALTKILAHPLGFTRRPITPRNHIPENMYFPGRYAPYAAFMATPLLFGKQQQRRGLSRPLLLQLVSNFIRPQRRQRGQ